MSEQRWTVFWCPVHGLRDGGFVGTNMSRPPYESHRHYCLSGHAEPQEVEALEFVSATALEAAEAHIAGAEARIAELEHQSYVRERPFKVAHDVQDELEARIAELEAALREAVPVLTELAECDPEWAEGRFYPSMNLEAGLVTIARDVALNALRESPDD